MGHPSYDRNVDESKMGTIADTGWAAPCLSRAILRGKVGQFEYFKTQLDGSGSKIDLGNADKFDDDLAALLGHIQERLEGGLDEAWLFADDGYGGVLDYQDFQTILQDKTPPTADKAQTVFDKMAGLYWFLATAEERWARAFTERFIFSKYADPAVIYKVQGDDVKLSKKALYESFPTVYPIAVPCQSLSTYCVLSRGASADSVGISGSVELGCTGGVVKAPAFKSMANPNDVTLFRNTRALVDYGVTPGSVLVFNPGGPDYLSQDKGSLTHVASVLRVYGDRIQFIDTGVLVGSGDQGAGGEGGTSDHGFVRGELPNNAAKSGVGVGVMPETTEDNKAALAAWADKVNQAKPLGLVRLAIVDMSGSPPVVRFVSKLLHMRYPVARLAWSLRGLPVAGLSVLWFVYMTQGQEWSQALVDAAPDAKPLDLQAIKFDPKKPNLLNLANVLHGQAGGGVTVYRHHEDGAKVGWARDFGAVDATVPEGFGYHLCGTDLHHWCANPRTFTQRFVAPAGNDKGTADGSATAPTDAYKDNNFFEPPASPA